MAYDNNPDDKSSKKVTVTGQAISGTGTAVEWTGSAMRYPGKKLGELGSNVMREASLDDNLGAKMLGYPYGGAIWLAGKALEVPGMVTEGTGEFLQEAGQDFTTRVEPDKSNPDKAATGDAPSSYMNSVPPEEAAALRQKLEAGNPAAPSKAEAVTADKTAAKDNNDISR